MKISGVVIAIEGAAWWARLITDDTEYEAEMTLPLPSDAKVGSYFTIHRPRNGDLYVYWIRKPLVTKRQLKKARIKARKLLELLQ